MAWNGKKALVALLALAVLVWWFWPDGGTDARRATPRVGGESATTVAGDTSASRAVGISRAGKAGVAELQETLERRIASGEPVTVEGRVVSASTGKLVPYVDVVFRGRGVAVTATSGSDGRYSAELSPDRYTVRAIGDGVLGSGGEPLVVAGAEDLSFDLTVQELATISGQVVDEQGRPAAGARVEYGPVTRAQKDHKKFGDWAAIVEADSSGRFELRVIAGGDVHIDAYSDERRGHAYLRDVDHGGRREGVRIQLDGGVLIAGIVLDPGGSPVAGATVQAYMRERDQHMTERHETTTDEHGRFAFDRMISGRLTLEATAPGHAPSAPEPRKLAPGADELIELRLQRPQAISGRVLGPDGRPRPGVTVTAVRKNSRLPGAETTAAHDGSFIFEHLDSGPHTVEARTDTAAASAKKISPPASDLTLRLAPTGGG